MAYTRAWNESLPAGTRAANELDDVVRELKADLRERFNDVLLVSMSADPVVAHAKILGNNVGKTLHVSHTTFVFTDPAAISALSFYDTDHVIFEPGVTGIVAAFMLPQSIFEEVTITRVKWLVDNNDTVNLSLQCQKYSFDTSSTLTTIFGVLHNTAAKAIVDSGVLSHPLGTAGFLCLLKATKSSGIRPQIYGAQITYSCPDSRATL